MFPSNDWIAGAAGGAAGLTAGHPFDTVKVHLQFSQRGQYPSSYACFQHIVHTQGVRGLYKGLSAPLAGGSFEAGLNYAVYGAVNRHWQTTYNSNRSKEDPRGWVVAGGVAGVALSLVLSPTELIKCRLQSASAPGQPRYTGPIDCIQQILSKEGSGGIWRGLTATLTREIPGNALFFTAYESLRQVLPRPVASSGQTLEVSQLVREASSAIISGGIAGSVFWCAMLPVDMAKTRIQSALPGTAHDIGIRQHLSRVYAEAGVRGLYAGLGPTVIRAFPANACQWLVYEMVMQVLRPRLER